MTEERMRAYVLNDGPLFTILNIDYIRDGGTKVIQTTKQPFWLNKDHKTFHTGYPTTEENVVTDPLTVEYLVERFESFTSRRENEVKLLHTIIQTLKG